MLRGDCASPDITPSNSLPRRRSRVLSEEDESNLMELLRSSGHENGSYERKSVSLYGGMVVWIGLGLVEQDPVVAAKSGLIYSIWTSERIGSDRARHHRWPKASHCQWKKLSWEWDFGYHANGFCSRTTERRQKIESWLQAIEADGRIEELMEKNWKCSPSAGDRMRLPTKEIVVISWKL